MAGALQAVFQNLRSFGVPEFVEDVFSTFLYTGNGGTQTITNNIDLAGEGGLVWAKSRVSGTSHELVDTVRGGGNGLRSNQTGGTTITDIRGFTSSGFTLGFVSGDTNQPGESYCSWTFRKAPKFFDVVTYTGTGSARTVAHNLGSVPGMIIIKRTDTTGSWIVYHRALDTPQTNGLILNATTEQQGPGVTGYWNSTLPTSTVFTVNTNASLNASGGTYVAYLFAHDAGGFGTAGTDNVISCGSFTTGASGQFSVNLGYEPQYVMLKSSSAAGNWIVQDVLRGLPTQDNGSGSAALLANTSGAETASRFNGINATGFGLNADFTNLPANTTFIYMAIRRPMKPPTSGTQVFAPVAQNAAANAVVTTNFPVDLALSAQRDRTAFPFTLALDRLRGSTAASSAKLATSSTNGEANFSSDNGFNLASNTSIIDNLWNGLYGASNSIIYWNFRRATGFFDIVCTSVFEDGTPVTHNLGVTPELIIVKTRSSASNWMGAVNDAGNIRNLSINTTSGGYLPSLTYSSYFNATTINPAGIYNGGGGSSKGSNLPVVIYLFASVAGVSKVGSYTGNGTTQTINCGFTSGARFVLIKRTDSTGDWFVWDSARGIVAGNDPYLLLNSTAAEVTNTDFVDTAATGFEISSTAPAAINASGGSFIFLAIS